MAKGEEQKVILLRGAMTNPFFRNCFMHFLYHYEVLSLGCQSGKLRSLKPQTARRKPAGVAIDDLNSLNILSARGYFKVRAS
jgi:hypothetical protein